MGLSAWKVACVLYILLFVTVQIIFKVALVSTTGYRHAHIVRFKAVINAELVYFLISIFVWRRIVALFDPPSLLRSIDDRRSYKLSMKPYRLAASFTTIAICMGNHLLYFHYYVRNWTPHIFMWYCGVSAGIWVYSAAFLLGFSIINFIARTIKSLEFGAKLMSPFLQIPLINKLLTNVNFQTIVSVILTSLLTLHGLYSATNYTVHNIDVKIKDLPDSANGLKLAVISDIHMGGVVSDHQLLRVVDLTNSLSPDAILIVGDLVDGSLDDLRTVMLPIEQLKAKYGIYFVTGNHEYYYGKFHEWQSYFEKIKINVLRNSNVKIEGICLVGVDDLSSEKMNINGHVMDIERAVNGCQSNQPIIALAHNPGATNRMIDETKRKIDLIISGHVHAGQFYVMAPLMYFLVPYYHGLYQTPKETQVYVSAGVHFWGAPIKMHRMAEITMITLKP